MGLDALRIRVFADGAELDHIAKLASDSRVSGFTTNPTLMRGAGIGDYETFARELLRLVRPEHPVSFEVCADDLEDMRRQALKIASWAENVVVKIPITNAKGVSTRELIQDLAGEGVKLNVTAIMTESQIAPIVDVLPRVSHGYLSVFAGRIADTGRDPEPIVRNCVELVRGIPQVEVIWASTREVFNIFQADAAGCHVITVPHHLLLKTSALNKDLTAYSLETVQAFWSDVQSAGLDF